MDNNDDDATPNEQQQTVLSLKGSFNGYLTVQEMYDFIKSKYDQQTSPYYAAARMWIDAIIDPLETRKWISMGIAAANQNSEIKPYKTGVIQT